MFQMMAYIQREDANLHNPDGVGRSGTLTPTRDADHIGTLWNESIVPPKFDSKLNSEVEIFHPILDGVRRIVKWNDSSMKLHLAARNSKSSHSQNGTMGPVLGSIPRSSAGSGDGNNSRCLQARKKMRQIK